MPLEDHDECEVNVVLLSSTECDACDDLKKEFAEQITDGSLRVIEDISDEGQAIMELNGPQTVPALVMLDCQGVIRGHVQPE